MRHAFRFAALAGLALESTLAAQPLERLTGKVVVGQGQPAKDADVRVEAIFGFAGGDFLGQRSFTTRTNAKGDWASLARIADSGDAALLVAAGRICLLMRDPMVARPLFRRALERDPTSFGAAIGMGSSAPMQRDVDAAGRAFSEARKLTNDKDERSYLTAAINELNRAHNVMRGTY
jgi:hypothetical protein